MNKESSVPIISAGAAEPNPLHVQHRPLVNDKNIDNSGSSITCIAGASHSKISILNVTISAFRTTHTKPQFPDYRIPSKLEKIRTNRKVSMSFPRLKRACQLKVAIDCGQSSCSPAFVSNMCYSSDTNLMFEETLPMGTVYYEFMLKNNRTITEYRTCYLELSICESLDNSKVLYSERIYVSVEGNLMRCRGGRRKASRFPKSLTTKLGAVRGSLAEVNETRNQSTRCKKLVNKVPTLCL